MMPQEPQVDFNFMAAYEAGMAFHMDETHTTAQPAQADDPNEVCEFSDIGFELTDGTVVEFDRIQAILDGLITAIHLGVKLPDNIKHGIIDAYDALPSRI